MSLDVERLLAFAHDLADLADAITVPAFEAGVDPDTKSDGTWVTEADTAVERALRRSIRDAYPAHAVLGEEDGLDGPEGAPTWVVDPIDGTTNFVKHNPIFATLVALQVDGREVLGVVSAPALGRRWDGLVDARRATENGRAIHVSRTAVLADAEVAFGGLKYFAHAGRLALVERLATTTARQRGYGDFWQHCLVASGATDVALEAEVSVWDLAAVKAVVEAAGGRFTDLDGVVTASGGSACSSNGLLHDDALALAAP